MARGFACCAAAALVAACCTARAAWPLASPDGRSAFEIALEDLGGTADYPGGERLYYQIERD